MKHIRIRLMIGVAVLIADRISGRVMMDPAKAALDAADKFITEASNRYPEAAKLLDELEDG